MGFICRYLGHLCLFMALTNAQASSNSTSAHDALETPLNSAKYFRIKDGQKIPLFDQAGKLIDQRTQLNSEIPSTLSTAQEMNQRHFFWEIPLLIKENIFLFLMDHPEAQLNLMRASRAFRRLAMPLEGLEDLTVPNFIRCHLLTVMIAGQSGNVHDFMAYQASGFKVLSPQTLQEHVLKRTFNSILNDMTLKGKKYCSDNSWRLGSTAHLAHDKRLLLPSFLMNPRNLNTFNRFETLDLQNNLLFTFPTLNGFTSLLNLYLNRNQFTIPPVLTGLVNLSTLYLSHNQLKHPPVLTTLTNLKFLNMIHNVLEVFPDIQGLHRLAHIYISDNHLSSLDNLAPSTSVKTLCLGNNKFTAFPPLTRLENLRGISLEENRLTRLPELRGLNKVTSIDLSDNALVEPPVLTNLQSLGQLRLSRNALTSWPNLKGLSQLFSLDIDGNPINTPLDTRDIKGVNSLKMNGVHLTTAPELRYLNNLHNLWIDERQLTIPGLLNSMRLLRVIQREQDLQLATLMVLYDEDTTRYKEFKDYHKEF